MSQNLLGDRHPNWKGGNIEYLTSLIHANQRVKDWAVTVLANAHSACERCGAPATEAHHKREVEELLALILDPANGEALCKACHVAHHSSYPFKNRAVMRSTLARSSFVLGNPLEESPLR